MLIIQNVFEKCIKCIKYRNKKIKIKKINYNTNFVLVVRVTLAIIDFFIRCLSSYLNWFTEIELLIKIIGSFADTNLHLIESQGRRI